MLGFKPAETPMDPNVRLGDQEMSIPMDRGRFQRLVDKLIYLLHTRPDISFAVSCISQFMHALTKKHIVAVNRVLRYLKGTPSRGMIFRKISNCGIEMFIDAYWAGAVVDRRSSSHYCFFVWGN